MDRCYWDSINKNDINTWAKDNEIKIIIFCCGYSKRFATNDIDSIQEIDILSKLLSINDSKLVYLSSTLVYGNVEEDKSKALEESMKCFPSGAYGMYKRILERFVLNKNKSNCVMRLVSCIGKRKKSGLMQSIETQIKQQKTEIKMLHGNSIRDYLFAENAAKIILEIATNNESKGIYNVGSGKGLKVSEIINKFSEFYNSKIDNISFGQSMKEDPNRLIIDINKIKSILSEDLFNQISNQDQIKRYLYEIDK